MSALPRRRRTVRRESLSHGLIITTMVDMFTLVLLFLLMFYDPMYDGSSPIDLPHAKVQAHAQTGPTISVTPDLISVGGAAVAPLQAGKLLPGTLGGGCCILPLVDSLRALVPPGGGEPPAVSVQCDKRVSWEALGAVLESASQAGFPRYRFIVAGE